MARHCGLLAAILLAVLLVVVGGSGVPAAPSFAPRQRTLVRGVVGNSVTLICHVLHQGDKAVSWVRSRDLQILTHSGVVFTADARVSVPDHPDEPDRQPDEPDEHNHALRIDRVRHADAGRYECQLNTEPKTSLMFDLTVLDEAEATAMAASTELPAAVSVWPLEGAVRAARGGAATLSCAATRTVAPALQGPPLNIRWLRDGRPLTLQAEGSEWQVSGAAYAESRLRLTALSPSHAGTYTCVAGTASADIILYVEESAGEVEAMQGDQVPDSAPRGTALTRAALLAPVTLILINLASLC